MNALASISAEEVKEILTADDLRKHLSLDVVTGKLYRKTVGRWQDTEAGTVTKGGYISVHIGGKVYYAHRIIWCLRFGEWPEGIIDHINGNKQDNRITNLRLASKSQNAYNREAKAMRGIRWYAPTGKWHARIVKDNKEHHIGYFLTVEEAREAYRLKAAELYGEFACRT